MWRVSYIRVEGEISNFLRTNSPMLLLYYTRSIFTQTQHNHDNHHYYYTMKTNDTQISF